MYSNDETYKMLINQKARIDTFENCLWNQTQSHIPISNDI